MQYGFKHRENGRHGNGDQYALLDYTKATLHKFTEFIWDHCYLALSRYAGHYTTRF
jgi:hypothetical protein